MKNRHGEETIRKKIGGIRRHFVPLLIFSIVINLLTLVLPIYMLQIYDRVLTSRNLTTLLLLTVVAFGLLAVGSLMTHYRSRMAARLGSQISQKLEQPAFNLLLKQRLEAQTVQAQVIHDLDAIRDFVAGGSMLRLFDIPWTPLFILVIFLLHPLTGSVALGFAVVLLLVDWLTDRQTINRNKDYAQAKTKADQFLDSSLRNAEELWSMGMVDGVGADWHRRRARALAEQSKAGDTKSSHDAYRKFIQQGAQMAMLGVGAYLAVQDLITPGTIVAGSIICSRALAPIGGISRSWRQYRNTRRAFAEFKRINEEGAPRGRHHVVMMEDPQLQAQDLAIDLGEGLQPVIRRLDFTLEAGQAMSVVGPSGTGKTLLVKTIIGARQPAGGTVKMSGIDLHHLSGDQLGRMIGYVPSKLSLFDGTLGQNIARFGMATIEELDQAVQRAGLMQSLAMMPNGYDTPMTVVAKHLSPIQFRFVALARALYGDPSLLVLDQIDDGLDQASLQTLINVIHYSQSLGQIVILVTNRASIVQQLDRVMILTKRGVETYCDVGQLPAVAQIT